MKTHGNIYAEKGENPREYIFYSCWYSFVDLNVNYCSSFLYFYIIILNFWIIWKVRSFPIRDSEMQNHVHQLHTENNRFRCAGGHVIGKMTVDRFLVNTGSILVYYTGVVIAGMIHPVGNSDMGMSFPYWRSTYCWRVRRAVADDACYWMCIGIWIPWIRLKIHCLLIIYSRKFPRMFFHLLPMEWPVIALDPEMHDLFRSQYRYLCFVK